MRMSEIHSWSNGYSNVPPGGVRTDSRSTRGWRRAVAQLSQQTAGAAA